MSEGNHSRDHAPVSNPTEPSPHRKVIHIVAGTACLLLTAAVVAQFMRANPAQSQTTSSSHTAASAHHPTPSQILGQVNSQPISYDQVAQECVARYGTEVLDSMINRLIIQQECEKHGVVVKESEIKQQVVEIAGKFNLPLDTWYQMLQSERDITPDQYHRDVIWPMLALKKLAGQDIEVTQEEMKKAFEMHYGPRVEARMILIDGNVRRATDIWNECTRDPDNFDALARKYSADPNSRPLGGVVPPIRRHSLPTKQIEQAAFALEPGEISALLQMDQNKYMILKCEGHTEPVVTDINDVWTELRSTLIEEKTQEAVATVFEGLKSRAKVINYLTNESTVGTKPGQLSRGPIQQTGGLKPATATR